MSAPNVASLVPASSIGVSAWHSALAACATRVLGVTSRGAFLLAPPQRILFVSSERYRSPLTITLDRSCDRWRALEIGAVAQFSATRLIFPSIAFAIALTEDSVWPCPLPAASLRPRTEQMQTLRAISDEVLTRRGDASSAALLSSLLNLAPCEPLSPEQVSLLEQLLALRQAVRANDDALLADGLTGLLGQGRGLTPSGDDMVIGALLMLARSLRLKSQFGSKNMLKRVVAVAYQQTTTISANLIECAADGQGDERLLAVVDGISTGAPSIDEYVDYVLDWGSSSGIDALVGMAVAL
jgi:hypothetical protein